MVVHFNISGKLEHYRVNYPGMLSHFIIDQTDATLAADFDSEGISVHLEQTIMKSLEDKRALARACLALAG